MPSWDLALYHSMLQHLSDTENEFNLVSVLLWTTQSVVQWDKHVRCAAPELAVKGALCSFSTKTNQLSVYIQQMCSKRFLPHQTFAKTIFFFKHFKHFWNLYCLHPCCFLVSRWVTSISELVKNLKPFAGACIMCEWVRTNETVTH